MADILAVVSKAIFERELVRHNLSEGQVWPTTTYESANKGLSPLGEEAKSRLFLVTVRPPNEALWLVAILDKPKLQKKQWVARANVTPICDVSNLRGEIRFVSGTGLPTKSGVLGMSLQTPRALTEEDATLLANAKPGTKPAKKGAAAAAAATTTTTTTRATRKKKKTSSARGASRPTGTSSRSNEPPTPTIDQKTLLAHWQETRSTEVADVLQCVPVDAAWKERLAWIASGSTSYATLGRLKTLPDDPRVTVFLIECLRKARWPGSSARSLWKLIFRRLVELGDARAIEPLRAAAASPPYFFGAGHTAWIVSQITATADELEKNVGAKKKHKTKSDEQATRVLIAAQAVTTVPSAGWFAVAKPVSDSLINQVWAAPDDDGVRSVVADALLEQNDPWGELISLQLQSTGSGGGGKTKHRDQVKTLVRKLVGRIAGPLRKVCDTRGLIFERGFLASCVFGKSGMIGRRLWEDALKAPHWATVHTVQFAFHSPRWCFASFYQTAPIASLRTIKIGSIVLSRTTPTAPWAVTAPDRVDARLISALTALLKGMPLSERARIPTPSSKGVAKALEGYKSAAWDSK